MLCLGQKIRCHIPGSWPSRLPVPESRWVRRWSQCSHFRRRPFLPAPHKYFPVPQSCPPSEYFPCQRPAPQLPELLLPCKLLSSTCFLGGYKHCRIYFSISIAGRCVMMISVHARHFSRHDVHQHGGRIDSLSTRHIDADPGHRSHFLSQQRPILVDC